MLRVVMDGATPADSASLVRKARRFTSRAMDLNDFASELFGELIEGALTRHRQRVETVLVEAEKARKKSVLCEADSADRLEEILRGSSGPNAESFVRQVARSQVTRATKSLSQLRAAMLLMEEEMEVGQHLSAADAARTAARLIAQREASVNVIRVELERTEMEGAVSIRGLQQELRRLHAESSGKINERDVQIEEFRRQVAIMEHQLSKQDAARQSDRRVIEKLQTEATASRLELHCLEHDLRRTQLELVSVKREVEVEENGRAADAIDYRQDLADEVARKRAERKATEDALEARLEANGLETSAAKASIDKAMQLERGLNDQLGRLHRAKEDEAMELQAKIDLLGRQVAALQASSSTRRSLLYWAGMQISGSPQKVNEMIESLQLDDPESWLQWKPKAGILSSGLTPEEYCASLSPDVGSAGRRSTKSVRISPSRRASSRYRARD